MVTFLKLGGSLITDKRVERAFRAEEMRRLAHEISMALQENPDLKLIIGHGSGSFGHFEAKKYNTIAGVHSIDEWQGYAQVSTVASELNYLVAKALNDANVPILRLQPSASAICKDGHLVQLAISPIQLALEHKLIPLVNGDVAHDTVRGGTIISTETILIYLATHIPFDRIILLGEVEGVYDNSGKIIPEITSGNFEYIKQVLGDSDGVDVTGGMISKVTDMLALAQSIPNADIHICGGLKHGLLHDVLLGKTQDGTTISNKLKRQE